MLKILYTNKPFASRNSFQNYHPFQNLKKLFEILIKMYFEILSMTFTSSFTTDYGEICWLLLQVSWCLMNFVLKKKKKNYQLCFY